ncbi:MAG: microcin C ABC transporter permease YejB [Candidatus Sungiibacteriota bacterium]
MWVYIIRRLLFIPPVLFLIMVVNFAIIQFVPGGPVEKVIAQITGKDTSATQRITGEGSSETLGERQSSRAGSSGNPESKYRGARGIDPELIAAIEKQFGFDRPAHERLWLMMKNYIRFDFGESFFRDRKVTDLLVEKLPVSVSLGLWSTLLIYLISIPLGVRKALKDGSTFDVATSGVVIVGYAIPGFLFAILLIVLFAGGSYWKIFPLGGLMSENWRALSFLGRVADYFWHMTLPLITLVIGGFAGLTMLTKNSFLEEVNKQYVMTARAKGLSERTVLFKHAFRNAMLLVVAGFPSVFVGILFTGNLLVEIIFSLDGLGLMGYEAAINRDYPVMFGTLYLFTLLGLVMNLAGDLMYVVVDPRIDFGKQGE